MTVGAVIVPDGVAGALADATGRTAVRRIVDSAWAGGAMPIMVVAADPDGRIARIYRNVRPSEHSAQVIADLEALRAREISQDSSS